MATLVREWVLNPDDSVNGENLTKLREEVKDKKCQVLLKNKKVCGRNYKIHCFGRCGCQFHEDYSYALQALSKLDYTE
jgi:hypothetical protein